MGTDLHHAYGPRANSFGAGDGLMAIGGLTDFPRDAVPGNMPFPDVLAEHYGTVLTRAKLNSMMAPRVDPSLGFPRGDIYDGFSSGPLTVNPIDVLDSSRSASPKEEAGKMPTAAVETVPSAPSTSLATDAADGTFSGVAAKDTDPTPSSSPACRVTKRKHNAEAKTKAKAKAKAPSKSKQQQNIIKTESDDAPAPKAKQSSGSGPSQRHNNLLERNRVAASKCREKKKQFVNGLEETKLNLEKKHSGLVNEFNELQEEVNQMKAHLMAHASCDDPNIDQWIKNEAMKYVTRATQQGLADDGLGRRSSNAESTDLSSSRRGSMQWSWDSVGGSVGEEDESAQSPLEKFEAINYDYMPDEMFQNAVSPGQVLSPH